MTTEQKPKRSHKRKPETANPNPPSLETRIKGVVGALPPEAAALVTDLLELINNQGKAITDLQQAVLGQAPAQAGDLLTRDSEIVGGDGKSPAAKPTDPGQIGKLHEIMSWIREISQGQGGGGGIINTGQIEQLVAQREAINKLIPPSPYEQLAERVGIQVLDNFAKKIGVGDISQDQK